MVDLNKEREAFEALPQINSILVNVEFYFSTLSMNYKSNKPDHLHCVYFINGAWYAWQEKAKAPAVPTWISVEDEEPPTDTMVLICWSEYPEIDPEIDYMTCDEDLNHIWANYDNDPPTHWMHFHKVPSKLGAEP